MSKRMSQQKGELIELSDQQAHPGRADAADFVVMSPADAAKMSVPACHGLNPSEYRQACDESDALNHAKKTSGLETHPKQP